MFAKGNTSRKSLTEVFSEGLSEAWQALVRSIGEVALVDVVFKHADYCRADWEVRRRSGKRDDAAWECRPAIIKCLCRED